MELLSLNEDIFLYYIFPYLVPYSYEKIKYKGFINLKLVCKKFNELLNQDIYWFNISNQYKFNMTFLNNTESKDFNIQKSIINKLHDMASIDYYFPKEIINIFGSIHNLSNIPILDIKEQMGSSDYIDFILKDTVTHKIMRGKDKYNRLFLCFRYKLNDINNRFSPEVFVETIFQRYTNNSELWTCGGHDGLNMIKEIGNSHYLNEVNYNYLRRLVNGKSCRTIYYDNLLEEYTELPKNFDKNDYLNNDFSGDIFLV